MIKSDGEIVRDTFEIEDDEHDADEDVDDDGSSSGGSDVSRKGSYCISTSEKSELRSISFDWCS